MNLRVLAEAVIEKRERWIAQSETTYANEKYQDYLCARANLKDALGSALANMRTAPYAGDEDGLDHVAKTVKFFISLNDNISVK